MILTTYNCELHGLLPPNLASDPKSNSEGEIFQIVEFENERVFLQLERCTWASINEDKIAFEAEGNAIYIRYFSSNATISNNVDALKVAIIDYLDAFYLKGVAIEFVDLEMDTKKFAEIVHGFRSERQFEPFLKLQWRPIRKPNGIRFIFQPKR